MATIKVPSAARQIGFHQLLIAAREMWLINGLSKALAVANADVVRAELADYVPQTASNILAAAGIRDEYVFPTPTIIATKPTLVGYYRLLLGLPQKTFYRSDTGMSLFKTLEEGKPLTEKQRAALPDFCSAMGLALGALVSGISPSITPDDVAQLPILTLGQLFQGANNNKIGKIATQAVFVAISEVVEESITSKSSNTLTLKNSSKRDVHVALSSDPDVTIEELTETGVRHKKVALEIKGGTDASNAHNRAGEAEKSHQKAKKAGYKDFWTLIALKTLDLAAIKAESPTTTEWFDVESVLTRSGADWKRFQEQIEQAVSIPPRTKD